MSKMYGKGKVKTTTTMFALLHGQETDFLSNRLNSDGMKTVNIMHSSVSVV